VALLKEHKSPDLWKGFEMAHGPEVLGHIRERILADIESEQPSIFSIEVTDVVQRWDGRG
jgi:hypothetical protein